MIAAVLTKGLERRWGLAGAPPEKFWGAFDSNSAFSGEHVNAQTALEVGAFFACVRLLTMTAGMTPLMVYKGEQRDRARDSQQWRMLHDSPNEETSPDAFWQLIVGDMIIGNGRWGDAFIEKARVNGGPRAGQVAELYRLSPWKVTVDREKTGSRRKTFKIEGDPQTYFSDMILHIPGFTTGCLRGESIVHMARQDLGTAVSRERYEGSFYANGATFDGYLKTASTLSDVALGRIMTAWKNAYGGHKHGTPVLEADLDYHPVSPPMRDQQFSEMSRQTANKVARWFGIDPEMIGGDRSSDTYATVEGRALHFLTFALDPWLVRIEKGLARDPDLFAGDLFPEFLRSALLRVDAKTRWEIYGTAIEHGVYSPNTVLFKENEPPRQGGDKYLETPPGTAPARSNGHNHDADVAALLT